MTSVTQLLVAIDQGDAQAGAALLPLVYDELRKLAAAKLAEESPGQTLQATALVHEAYLRLVDHDQARSWNSKAHFFRAAAEAMRRILVDNARRKKSRKRGGAWKQVDLACAAQTAGDPPADVEAIHAALNELTRRDPEKAELVKLRYFAGLSVAEAAEVLQISRATADRHWRYAKTWLYCALQRSDAADQA